MKKSIISLILISAIALSTAVALADTETSCSPSVLVSEPDWTVMNGAFGGSLSGQEGVYSISPSSPSDAAYALPNSSNGNFELDIPFTLNDAYATAYVGLSTSSDPTANTGWTVIGNGPDGALGYSTGGLTNINYFDSSQPSLGTEYTAKIVSTDGGQTATLSVDGYPGSATINLNGAPTYVILYLNNNGTTGDGANTPDVNGVTYDYYQANTSASPTPTPAPASASNPSVIQDIQNFYANQPVVHMSNESVIYYPNGSMQTIGGNAAAKPTAMPVVSATPNPQVNATMTPTVTPPTVTTAPVTPSATQTKSPGFEIALAGIGMVLALALIVRKKG